MAKTTSNIYARRNTWINGNLDFWQRALTHVSPSSGSYTADRWKIGFANAGTRTVSRSTLVPNAQSTYSIQHVVNTADASVGATDNEGFLYYVEGNDLLPLAGKVITLSFWVRSSLTGTYCVSFRNNATDRSYVSTYTVNVANTWEKKSITLTHSTAGTWLYDTGAGMIINFTLMAGTTLQTSTLDSWQAGNFLGHASGVNFMATSSNQINITQVMLNEGPDAQPFIRAGNDVSGELIKCQRYFEKSYELDTPVGTATAANAVFSIAQTSQECDQSWFYKVSKRVQAGAFVYSPVTGTQNRFDSGGDKVVNVPGGFTWGFYVQSGAVFGSNANYSFHWAADAEL